MTYPRIAAENSPPNPQAGTGPQSRSLSHTENLRAIGTEFGLWLFCNRRACRRTHSCRGNPRVCCANYGPLLPDGVKLWFVMFDDAKACGLSFEEMLEEVENSPAVEACAEWQAALVALRNKSQRQQRGAATTDL
jgi:hypothetical protein